MHKPNACDMACNQDFSYGEGGGGSEGKRLTSRRGPGTALRSKKIIQSSRNYI